MAGVEHDAKKLDTRQESVGIPGPVSWQVFTELYHASELFIDESFSAEHARLNTDILEVLLPIFGATPDDRKLDANSETTDGQVWYEAYKRVNFPKIMHDTHPVGGRPATIYVYWFGNFSAAEEWRVGAWQQHTMPQQRNVPMFLGWFRIPSKDATLSNDTTTSTGWLSEVNATIEQMVAWRLHPQAGAGIERFEAQPEDQRVFEGKGAGASAGTVQKSSEVHVRVVIEAGDGMFPENQFGSSDAVIRPRIHPTVAGESFEPFVRVQ